MKLTIAGSFFLCLCMLAPAAHARDHSDDASGKTAAVSPGAKNKAPGAKKPANKPKKPRELLILERGGNYPVQTARAVHTFLDFPGEIRDHTRAVDHPHFLVKKVRPDRLLVLPAPNAPPNAKLDVAVDFYINNATFLFQVGKEDQADHQVNVHVVSLAAIQALAVKIAQPQVQEANEKTDQAEKSAENEKLRLQSQALINQIDGTPHCQKPLHPIFKARRSSGDKRVTWRLFQSCWDETTTHLLVPFEVENNDSNPFRATRNVIAMDRRDTRYSARIAFMDRSARPAATPVKRASETPVTNMDESVDANGQDEPALEIAAEVGVEQTARGVIAIRLDRAVSIKQLRIRLMEPHTDEPGQARYLEASVSQWSRHRPDVAPYTGDDWAREVAEQEAREARATQLILGPSVAYGVCWLSSGPANNNAELDATDCTTAGIRLTKGIIEMVAFEVEAVGGWTGNAEFAEQTRSARLGRVTLAGILRFGQFTIPYARFAVGAQGTSYDGLESGFEFNISYAVGGGLQRRVGERVMIGAGVSGGASTDNAFRVLEAGAYVAYSWNP